MAMVVVAVTGHGDRGGGGSDGDIGGYVGSRGATVVVVTAW